MTMPTPIPERTVTTSIESCTARGPAIASEKQRTLLSTITGNPSFLVSDSAMVEYGTPSCPKRWLGTPIPPPSREMPSSSAFLLA